MLVIIPPIEKEGAYYSAPITWSVDMYNMYTVDVP